jgi:hypothetical protein
MGTHHSVCLGWHQQDLTLAGPAFEMDITNHETTVGAPSGRG